METKKLIIFMPSIEGGGADKNLFIIPPKIKPVPKKANKEPKMTNMPDTNKLCNPWAAFTNEIRIYTPKITNPICIIPAKGAKINNIITTIVWKITCNTCVQAIIDKI